MTHIVVNPHHMSFGPYHRDPRTGETWTTETAAEYARKCEGSSRSGGIGCEIYACDCPDWDATHETRARFCRARTQASPEWETFYKCPTCEATTPTFEEPA